MEWRVIKANSIRGTRYLKHGAKRWVNDARYAGRYKNGAQYALEKALERFGNIMKDFDICYLEDELRARNETV